MKRVALTILTVLAGTVLAASHLEPVLADLRERLSEQEQEWLGWALQLERLDTTDIAERYYEGELGLWAEITGEVTEVLAYAVGEPEPEVILEGAVRIVCWPVGNFWRVLQTGDVIVVRAWATESDFGVDLEDCLLGRPHIVLLQYDENRNGRISCAETRLGGIAPVVREHPAYAYMTDGDGDGVVCE